MSRHRNHVLSCLIGWFALANLACATAPSLGSDWVLLGQRSVSDATDHDSISAAGEGNFKAIKILVEGHAVEFHEVKVHFANGGVQTVSLRALIPAGGESRVIDIAGNDRFISRVDFVYDAQTKRARRNAGARVLLYGRR